MTVDLAITIAKELINITAADLLLLGLVAIFFFSGLGYKIKSGREVSKMRAEVTKLTGNVNGMGAKEKTLRGEMQNLLNAQNGNMVEINTLKSKKIEIGKMPIDLSRDLEDLVSWCHSKHIMVNPERRMAAKRPTPQGRRM